MLNQGLVIGLSVVAVMVPFILSLAVSLRPSTRPKTIDDYFLYGRSLDVGMFVTSSIGYSTQVASIYLFLLWYLAYGLSALIVPVFWGLGYWLMARLLKRRDLDGLLRSEGNDCSSSPSGTLHGFIGDRIGGSPLLKQTLIKMLALSTLLGLGGALVAEIDYASKGFLVPAILGPQDGDQQAIILLVFQFMVLLFSGCYVLWGGYKAAIDTDHIQVPLAYCTFVAIILLLAIFVSGTGHAVIAIAATVVTSIFLAAALWTRRSIHRVEQSHYRGYRSDRLMFVSLLIACFAALAWQIPGLGRDEAVAVPWEDFVPRNGLFLGFGIFGAVSLAVTNFFWQLIDLSCMQRLQSVRFDGSAESYERLALGLTTSGWESAGVWALVVVFATLTRALGVESLDNFVGNVMDLPIGWRLAIVPTLCFMVTAFMLSTVDCFISASAFVVYYDLVPWDKTGGRMTKGMTRPRWITLAFLVGVFTAYWVLRQTVERDQQLSLVLYGFYSLQASIFVAILGALFLRNAVSVLAAIAAVTAGWIAGFLCATTETPPFGIPDDSWWVMPPLAAIMASVVVFAIVQICIWTVQRLKPLR